MKGLGWLLIAILSGVALWQLSAEFQRGTFGMQVRPTMNQLSPDDVLHAAGPPLTKYGENDGGETWQYTNGRIVRFNYRGQVVEQRGFSTFITPPPRRPRTSLSTTSPLSGTNDGPPPPNLSSPQYFGGGGYAPVKPATPTDIERQRGWKSSSPLDQPAR